MNLQNWMSQAKAHWQEFQPTKFKELKQSGTLGKALQDAAERTYQEMNALTEAGFAEHEAWEMVRESYLFPPEEATLKEKSDREPVASGGEPAQRDRGPEERDNGEAGRGGVGERAEEQNVKLMP